MFENFAKKSLFVKSAKNAQKLAEPKNFFFFIFLSLGWGSSNL